MKNQEIKIGCESFILNENKEFFPYKKSITLFDCYAKPSKRKIEIFDYWKIWFLKNSEFYDDFISIASYNKYTFTLFGVITINGSRYDFLITKTRKEIYKRR